MTTIDRALLKTLREDITAALAAVGQKHGVVLEATSASFTAADATFKLLVVPATTGRPLTQSTAQTVTASARDLKAAADMNLRGELHGCENDWAGKTFQRKTMTYTIIGLLPGKAKNCVLVRTQNGTDYIMPPVSVRAYLL